MDPEETQSIVDQYGYKVGSWPSSYLRLPLNGKPRTLSFCCWEDREENQNMGIILHIQRR